MKIMKLVVLEVLTLLFAVSAFGQQNVGAGASVNQAGTMNNSKTLNNAKSINSTKGESRPSVQMSNLESGDTNDSNWTGENYFSTVEEAVKMAAEQQKALANSNVPLAQLAAQAKAEAQKAAKENDSKTVVVAIQDKDGNIVYIRKARKQ